MKSVFVAGAMVLGLTGCVTDKPLYEWGSYPRDLLRYSKNPGDYAKFSVALRADIEKAEAVRKVPPGLYAEYGYTLLEAGDSKAAIEYFAKERDRWPEAAPLMSKLIGRLSGTNPQAPNESPAPAMPADTQKTEKNRGSEGAVQ